MAVRCGVAGDFDLRIESSRSLGDTTVALGVLSVEGGSIDMDDDLELWRPCRCVRAPVNRSCFHRVRSVGRSVFLFCFAVFSF